MSESVDTKAREIGDVYVLANKVNGRAINPWTGRAWRAWGHDVVADPSIPLPDPLIQRASALMDAEKKIIVRTTIWFDAAYSAVLGGYPVPPRKKDTWERVLRCLIVAGEFGCTSREIQGQTGLGHGAVSSALSTFQQCGRVERLA